MDADTRAADKILSFAMCVLTLAVSRRTRENALGVGYVVTSDPYRSRVAYGSLLGSGALAEASPTVLRLVREKLRQQSIGQTDAGPLIRHNSIGRPWFDVSVNESPHEIFLKVAEIYPVKA